MDMKTFLQSVDAAERKRVATQAGTSVNYLYQIAGGHRDPSRKMAIRLSEASNGALTVVELMGLQSHIAPMAIAS